MGISGRLQGLKPLARQGNVQEFAEKSLAIDASSWLHKSVYSFAPSYVEASERGVLDNDSIHRSSSYIIKRCEELLTHARIQCIYLVFDGKRCPLKAVTNQERERRRTENLVEARRYRQLGDKEKMFEKYKSCIKVKDILVEAVAMHVSRRFRDGRVQIVRAPYEADPQLVKICVDGLAQAIITEDSDVLVYTAACQIAVPILFKLDRHSGQCDVLSMEWLLTGLTQLLQGCADNDKKQSGLEQILHAFMIHQIRQPGLGSRLFVQSCILAGCDYSPNELSGVGLVTAFKQIRSVIHRECQDRFRTALNIFPAKVLKGVNKIAYEELLAKCEAIFYYHPVCVSSGEVVFLNDPTGTSPHLPCMERFGADWSFLGDVSAVGGGSIVAWEQGARTDASPPEDRPPLAEIRVIDKSNKRLLTTKYDVTDEHLSENDGLNEVRQIVPMTNPYGRSRKRKERDIGEQQPTKRSSQLNRFDKYTHSQKENWQSANSSFLDGVDVRFVKIDYSKTRVGVRALQIPAFGASLQPPGVLNRNSHFFQPLGETQLPGHTVEQPAGGVTTYGGNRCRRDHFLGEEQRRWSRSTGGSSHQFSASSRFSSIAGLEGNRRPALHLPEHTAVRVDTVGLRSTGADHMVGQSKHVQSGESPMIAIHRTSLSTPSLASTMYVCEARATDGEREQGGDFGRRHDVSTQQRESIPSIPRAVNPVQDPIQYCPPVFAEECTGDDVSRSSRRVTFDSPQQQVNQEPARRWGILPGKTTGLNNPDPLNTLYGDLLSSPEQADSVQCELKDDAIVNSPGESVQVTAMSSSRFFRPRPKSIIGPAKTLRAPLFRAFQHQGEPAGNLHQHPVQKATGNSLFRYFQRS